MLAPLANSRRFQDRKLRGALKVFDVDDLAVLLESFKLQRVDDNCFAGTAAPLPLGLYESDIPSADLRVYGGQIFSQALRAAINTMRESRNPHSMHGYFLRLGMSDSPIYYQVYTMREGGSFSTRQVTATQNGKRIFVAAVSFQAHEEGFSFQPEMSNVDMPEDIPDSYGLHKKIIGDHLETDSPGHFAPLDIRLVAPDNWGSDGDRSGRPCVWLKTKGRLPDDFSLHQTLMAYMSDLYLFGSSMLKHNLTMSTPNLQPASLDHTLWIHDEFRADEWLLYELSSEWTGHGRGLNRGRFFSRDGRMVGSTMQEGLMRIKPS